MITLSRAVSVELVMLGRISTGITQTHRYQLYVNLPLSCVGFPSQSSETELEVLSASSGVTWLTFIILAGSRQSISDNSNYIV